MTMADMDVPDTLMQSLYNAAERYITAERELGGWQIDREAIVHNFVERRALQALEEKKYRQWREFEIAKTELLNMALKIAAIG